MKAAHWVLMAIVALGAVCARADDAPGTPEKPGAAHVPETPAAPEKDWTFTTGYDFYTQYIFRGFDMLNDNPLHVPYVVGTWKGFSAYWYGYYGDGTRSIPGNETYSETDLGVDYTLPLLDGKLSLTGGVLAYVYLDNTSGINTEELYAKAVVNTFLSPTFTINWDVDAFEGGYGTVSISQSFDIGSKFGLKAPMTLAIIPSASLGIDFNLIEKGAKNSTDWNDVLLGVNIPWQITDHLCVHAQVQYSIALNHIHDINADGNELIGAVGASVKF